MFLTHFDQHPCIDQECSWYASSGAKQRVKMQRWVAAPLKAKCNQKRKKRRDSDVQGHCNEDGLTSPVFVVRGLSLSEGSGWGGGGGGAAKGLVHLLLYEVIDDSPHSPHSTPFPPPPLAGNTSWSFSELTVLPALIRWKFRR